MDDADIQELLQHKAWLNSAIRRFSQESVLEYTPAVREKERKASYWIGKSLSGSGRAEPMGRKHKKSEKCFILGSSLLSSFECDSNDSLFIVRRRNFFCL